MLGGIVCLEPYRDSQAIVLLITGLLGFMGSGFAGVGLEKV